MILNACGTMFDELTTDDILSSLYSARALGLRLVATAEAYGLDAADIALTEKMVGDLENVIRRQGGAV